MNSIQQKYREFKKQPLTKLADLCADELAKKEDGMKFLRVPSVLLTQSKLLDLSLDEIGLLMILMTIPKTSSLNKHKLPTNSRSIYPSMEFLSSVLPHSRAKITRLRNSLVKKNYITLEETKRTPNLILTNLFSCLFVVSEIVKDFGPKKKNLDSPTKVMIALYDEFRQSQGLSQLERDNKNAQQKEAARKSMEKREEGILVQLPDLSPKKRKSL